jgi:hypothetical protein
MVTDVASEIAQKDLCPLLIDPPVEMNRGGKEDSETEKEEVKKDRENEGKEEKKHEKETKRKREKEEGEKQKRMTVNARILQKKHPKEWQTMKRGRATVSVINWSID